MLIIYKTLEIMSKILLRVLNFVFRIAVFRIVKPPY